MKASEAEHLRVAESLEGRLIVVEFNFQNVSPVASFLKSRFGDASREA